ncbi:glycoside hydrolase family 65 protein [Spirosoma montaniterrae]|uniref:Trehalase n=1 Tax=Spirosoma montaniterrae TaxID=1178516 RepID=A0A1P9WXG3_9BACT|nr:glycosyl hydrolase family 65 protein [Spirosoma montaniterrae]AQG80077.1 trehalase [Spirosoma montaniterrae]
MMKYNTGSGDLTNWIVEEAAFTPKFQGKCEAIFCQGNGYMGVRCATEESYTNQVRNTFVAGTFNKFDEYDVTELPNAADVTALDIWIDGDLFSLDKGSFTNYSRTLNLKTGEVVRSFEWTNRAGKTFAFAFRRFMSLADLHTMALHVSITPLNESAQIEIQSGINGQVSNSGAQHFHEGEKRIFDKQHLQMLQQTTQSKITFVHNATHSVVAGNETVGSRFAMDRRKVYMIYKADVQASQTLTLEKISNVYTTRDLTHEHLSLDELRSASIADLIASAGRGYNALLAESVAAWAGFWQQTDISINSQRDFDQLAIRFAMYHLRIMTPAHDSRMGVGAKGLSGEGYKGHSFWDTEIFLLPYFTYTFPEIGRSLLEYRYKTLGGAHKKALENGYKGAMYPWESAWMDDGEVTPVWGAADIVTGKSTKIWSGFIEQHITSDVAFGVWQYYQITGDEDFMERYGYEILLDTGIFWASRLEWNDERQRYHINEVIGPDEYKEHVDNDAFTNYTAYWCIENAISYYQKLKAEKPAVFARLNEKLSLDVEIPVLEERLAKLYLPQPTAEGVIPQDDTYLGKQIIDLSKYKAQEHVGSIFHDYSLDQVNQIQVSKQASVVMLMYLLEHKFGPEIKRANYNYYEPKTLHDSSLSLSTHAVLANDLGDTTLAYELFRRASEIDLGPGMKTSDHGVHAASLGGIWQIVVCGFGGVRMVGGKLRITPSLPEQIDAIQYPIYWQGNRLNVSVSKQDVSIVNETKKSAITLIVKDNEYTFTDELTVHL